MQSRTFRRTILFLLASCLLLLAAPAHAWPVELTILHVNDTHSHLLPGGRKSICRAGPIGGLARAATVIERVKANNPNVLVLHAGDAFLGDPMFNTYLGAPELAAMRWVGFDAMAVGNHEFDLGPDALLYSAATAFTYGRVPLLAANVDLSGYPALVPYIQPWIIRDVGGVRVGIFGMTTPNDPLSQPAPVVIRGQDEVVPIAVQTIKDLHAAGAQVVILLSHLGLGQDMYVASMVSGIDVIVGGHSHDVLPEPILVRNPRGARTLILQAGRFYEHIGQLRLRFQHDRVSFADYHLLDLDATVPEDPVIVSVLNVLKQGVNRKFGDLYCMPQGYAYAEFSDQADPRLQARDTPIGNLVTEALRSRGMTDIGFTASGLVSQGLPEGWLNGADIFRVVSYGFDPSTGLGFNLATFRISGRDLLKGLETVLALGGDSQPQVSGMRFAYDSRQPEGHRLAPPAPTINGESLELGRSYSVTTNVAVATLLPAIGVEISDVVPLDVFEFEALRDYIFHRGVVFPVSDGRVRDVSLWRTCEPGPLSGSWTCTGRARVELEAGALLRRPGAEVRSQVIRR